MNPVKRLIKGIFRFFGYEIINAAQPDTATPDKLPLEFVASRLRNIRNIQYACGENILQGWINVDASPYSYKENESFIRIDLLKTHPFPDNWFKFGFAEDFIEHLGQADLFLYLTEVYRTFKKGGVLRLSFPGLEGVLARHYKNLDYDTAVKGKNDAYTLWGHVHFCSRDELKMICRQIGFKKIQFVEYGISSYKDLRNLDRRKEQIGLNTYVEIIK